MAINSNRPMSPHLQVYKLPLTGIISVSHRMTGVMLSFGLLFFVYIVSALADSAEAYSDMQNIMGLWPVRVMYWGFIYALFFHLCHGVRHLIWDAGKSFEAKTLTPYALLELAASLALTVAAFLCVGQG